MIDARIHSVKLANQLKINNVYANSQCIVLKEMYSKWKYVSVMYFYIVVLNCYKTHVNIILFFHLLHNTKHACGPSALTCEPAMMTKWSPAVRNWQDCHKDVIFLLRSTQLSPMGDHNRGSTVLTIHISSHLSN